MEEEVNLEIGKEKLELLEEVLAINKLVKPQIAFKIEKNEMFLKSESDLSSFFDHLQNKV